MCLYAFGAQSPYLELPAAPLRSSAGALACPPLTAPLVSFPLLLFPAEPKAPLLLPPPHGSPEIISFYHYIR